MNLNDYMADEEGQAEVTTENKTAEAFKTALEQNSRIRSDVSAGFEKSENPFTASVEAAQTGNPQGNIPSTPQQGDVTQSDQYRQAQAEGQSNEELQQLRQELEQAKKYVEFGRRVEQNPDLYEHIKNFGNQPEEAYEEEYEPLVRPELPEDPYDSNAMREYHNQLLNYQEELAERKAQEISSAQVNAFQQQLYEQQMRQAQQNKLKQAMQNVQSQFGVDQTELQKFQQWAQDPRNTTMDNVYRLYQIATGNGTPPQAQSNNDFVSQQRYNQQSSNANLPQPLGQVSSAGAASKQPTLADLIRSSVNNGNGYL